MSIAIKNLRKIFLLAVIAASIFIWYAVFDLEARGNLSISFFDVGQGDSEFIQAENGNQVLIDGGPNEAILSKLGEAMPFWDRSIDLVVLTHPHADHLDGLLEVLKRYNVRTVIESGANHSIPEYAKWHQLLEEKAVEVIIAKAGQKIKISDSAYLNIFTPFEDFEDKSSKNIHDAMIASKLNYGSTSVLFMGDAEKQIEYRLIFSGADLKSDILKVGHHGSKTSTSEEFLKAVSPKFAIISAGRKNRYGHPHQDILDRLMSFGIKIFRTDQDGDIRFLSDGTAFIK